MHPTLTAASHLDSYSSHEVPTAPYPHAFFPPCPAAGRPGRSTGLRQSPGHRRDGWSRGEIKADLTGAKKLYLVVTDGGDGFACDWSNWVNPVIHGSFGDKKLTDFNPVKVHTGWGQVGLNKNAGGKPMSVNGLPAGNGFGVHAPALLEFDLPEGATAFTGTGALDDGGTSQANGSSVEFKV